MSIFTKEQLEKLPSLYEQDGKGDKAKVSLVVSLEDYVWLITEYSKEEELFFVYVSLADAEMSELGYVSKFELENLACKYPLVVEEVNMELKDAKNKYIFKENW